MFTVLYTLSCSSQNSIILLKKKQFSIKNYRNEMRKFVKNISYYAKSIKPKFMIITQNGNDLLLNKNKDVKRIFLQYVKSLDGVAQEDLFYGYSSFNIKTDVKISNRLLSHLQVAKNYKIPVFVTDYCKTSEYIKDSYAQSKRNGFVSYAATTRSLSTISYYLNEIINENSQHIITLSDVKNFLYLINPKNYSSKDNFIANLSKTNYDLLIIDLFFNNSIIQINKQLKYKENGSKRLVFAYLSIGEAEIYRYYWKKGWDKKKPIWISEENKKWPGNYKVKYWNKDWQNIIFGSQNSYVKKIIDAGFNGVYLDIIDAYEYFEQKTKRK